MDLTFEQTTERFGKLIHFMANKLRSSHNQVYTSEDFYQEGLIILYNCWNKYKEKSVDEFKTIFSVSLRRHLNHSIKKVIYEDENTLSSNNAAYRSDAGTTSEDTLELQDTFQKLDDNLTNVYIQDGLEQLKELISDDVIASAILEELLNPSERTIWEFTMDKARKKMIYDQGNEEVRLTTSMDIRMHHIARALGISLNDINRGLKVIREQANNVFR